MTRPKIITNTEIFALEVISVNMVVAVHNHLNSLPISELFLKDSLPRRLLL